MSLYDITVQWWYIQYWQLIVTSAKDVYTCACEFVYVREYSINVVADVAIFVTVLPLSLGVAIEHCAHIPSSAAVQDVLP